MVFAPFDAVEQGSGVVEEIAKAQVMELTRLHIVRRNGNCCSRFQPAGGSPELYGVLHREIHEIHEIQGTVDSYVA